jgi:GT2 family glycosyltransferase
MPALVTIVIPCFNSARWLEQAISSGLAQTWPATEVIVVDDGSTDNSLAIARKFGGRIELISTGNHGGNAARNTGWRAARGEWVQFLDADDFLEPGKIAQQFAETDGGRDADVIYSPVWIEDLGTGTRTASPIDTRQDLFGQWLAWEIPQTGGALWRRSALQSLGGWKEGQPCCQEHELYLRALQGGLRFQLAPTPHAVYRVWSEQTVCRRDPTQVVREKTALIDKLHSWLKERGRWTEAHERIAGQACFEMARTLAKYDVAEAARYHRERQEHHLLHLAGPAAPFLYGVAYHLFGFTGAERLAAARTRREKILPPAKEAGTRAP